MPLLVQRAMKRIAGACLTAAARKHRPLKLLRLRQPRAREKKIWRWHRNVRAWSRSLAKLAAACRPRVRPRLVLPRLVALLRRLPVRFRQSV